MRGTEEERDRRVKGEKDVTKSKNIIIDAGDHMESISEIERY